MIFRISFDLFLDSNLNKPVELISDNEKCELLENKIFTFDKTIEMDYDNDKNYNLLEIKNLQASKETKILIKNLFINDFEIDIQDLHNYFILSVKNNPYVKDHVVNNIDQICFNGKLLLHTKKDNARFWWSPFFHSSKKNDFVFDNRLLWRHTNNVGELPRASIDSQTTQKVYMNLPHFPHYRSDLLYDIGAFGCSTTFGYGLAEKDDVWPNKLTKNNLNLSLTGLGYDGIYLNLKNANEKFKWKKTIILLPNLQRMLFTFKLPYGTYTRCPVQATVEWSESWINKWSWQKINKNFDFDRLQKLKKSWHITIGKILSGKVDIYSKKILNKIISECKKQNKPFYISSWDEESYHYLQNKLPKKHILPFFQRLDTALDGLHPGPKSHTTWATQVMKIISH